MISLHINTLQSKVTVDLFANRQVKKHEHTDPTKERTRHR